jgi:hypothetical protein
LLIAETAGNILRPLQGFLGFYREFVKTCRHIGNSKIEIRNSKLETGKSKLENRKPPAECTKRHYTV